MFAGAAMPLFTGRRINSTVIAAGPVLMMRLKVRSSARRMQTDDERKFSVQTVAVIWAMFSLERDLLRRVPGTA